MPTRTSSASIAAICARSAVDPDVLEELGSLIPTGVIAVAESGIRTPADISRLSAVGYSAFLVGERLIVEPDPGAALEALRAWH